MTRTSCSKLIAHHAVIAVTLSLAMITCSPRVGAQSHPTLGGCMVFPADNVWNTPVDTLPRDPNSDAYIATIGSSTGLHADFGTVWAGAPNGIPFVVVPATQPLVNITFLWDDESDSGPYPIPRNPPIEGGPNATGDRHVLILQQGDCRLYEIYRAFPQANGSWRGDSGAVFDLDSNALRPMTWTSADAAGLAMLPGLVRLEEVQAGEIRHALRFTCAQTRRAFVWPARHYASESLNPAHPPMGQRFRLKAAVNIAPYPHEVRVILRAMKKYGIILADNGSNWYISGAPNPLWNDDALSAIGGIKGSDFEAVDSSSMMIDVNSGAARLCAGDINGSGVADTDDLLLMLGAWGPCEVCPPDVSPRGGNGEVNTDDLLLLLGAWGACP